MKLIQLLGKSIYINKQKIRRGMASSFSFLTSGNWSCEGKLNNLR